MSIHIYFSPTAPKPFSYMARIESRAADKDGSPRLTMLPLVFAGTSEGEARKRAEAFLSGKLDNPTRQAERQRASGEKPPTVKRQPRKTGKGAA